MQLSKYRFGLKVAGVIVFLCLLVIAQQKTSQIAGRVTDPNGAAIPDVSVTITSAKAGIQRAVLTDESGIFKVSVPAGVYYVTVDLPGDRKIFEVAVSPGESKTINFAMKPGEPPRPISDAAAPPPPEPTPPPTLATFNPKLYLLNCMCQQTTSYHPLASSSEADSVARKNMAPR